MYQLLSMYLAYSLYEYVLARIILGRDEIDKSNGMLDLRRSVIFLFVIVIFNLGFMSANLFLSYTGLALVDLCTRVISRRTLVSSMKFERWLIRQGILIFGVYISWWLNWPIEYNTWFLGLEKLAVPSSEYLMMVKESFPRAAIILLGYIFVIDGGTSIVKGILSKFPTLVQRALASLSTKKIEVQGMKRRRLFYRNSTINPKDEENSGEWIGILERIITLTFVLTQSYTAIAFALTAKSIARFKELDDKDFAEYYLLGTSASVATALLIGVLVRIVAGL
ncbi:MAG TPA: hypothetical protein VJN65_02490 [Bacteroidota bacterium]|nr:hypothetical protein [Bacteroidota bacterium]